MWSTQQHPVYKPVGCYYIILLYFPIHAIPGNSPEKLNAEIEYQRYFKTLKQICNL